MKILGIDISTQSTGWNILEDGKLIEYGKINPESKLSLNQKLYLFYVELQKIIEKYQPDEIAVEDVVFVASVKVAKILARFSAIPVLHAYSYLKKDIHLYEPTKWKKVLAECDGSAKKCEIQLSICEIFNLLDVEKINEYREAINEVKASAVVIDKKELTKMRRKLTSLKKKKENCRKEIHGLKENIKNEESRINNLSKDVKKNMVRMFDAISLEIYTQTGINSDIADSIGVSLALWRELNNV